MTAGRGPTRGWTDRRRRFVEHFLVDGDPTRAAIRAGFSPASARAWGPKLRNEPIIAQAIEQALAAERDRCHATREKLEHELGKVAFANPGAFVKVAGKGERLMDLADVAASDRAALTSITSSKTGIRISIKDKLKAAELLAKMKGWLESAESSTPRPRPIIRLPQKGDPPVAAPPGPGQPPAPPTP